MEVAGAIFLAVGVLLAIDALVRRGRRPDPAPEPPTLDTRGPADRLERHLRPKGDGRRFR